MRGGLAGSITTLTLVLLIALPTVSAASGFAFTGQGAKAMGMAGAFTAQADDGSAVFYNPGGLALLEEEILSGGLSTLYLNEGLYQGLSPGTGAGTASQQKTGLIEFPAHAYLTQQVGQVTLGVGASQPFLLSTDWSTPDSFAGRFINVNSSLKTYDLTSSVSWKMGSTVGVGIGVTYRLAEMQHTRRLSVSDPSTGSALDAASLLAQTDVNDGFGWTLGVLHKPNDSFSWGFTYRSKIKVNFQGISNLTQISTGNTSLDTLVAASFPFGTDLPITSQIDFPDSASLGFAYRFSENFLAEVDVQWTGWSSVQSISFLYSSDPQFDKDFLLNFTDSYTYRLGFEYRLPSDMALRFGVAQEQTPQSSAYVGPFLVDANRTLLAVGFGKDWLDVAFTWLDYSQRIITDNIDNINGNHRNSTAILSFTVTK